MGEMVELGVVPGECDSSWFVVFGLERGAIGGLQGAWNKAELASIIRSQLNMYCK
jgi:hypothetical protein